MALRPRSNPFAVIVALLLVLFLTTLGFHLMVPQRIPGTPGTADLHAATDLLLKVLGGIILLVLLYTVFARVARRDSSPSTGFVKDDVFLDIVARLRDKEHELERLRSAAEERAREVESYNENILRSVSSGVITFNQEGVVTTFNDAAGRILRLNREDVIGKTCAEVFGANSTVAGLLKRCLSTGESITREEFELRLPHGGRFWIGVSTTLLKDREGRLIGTTFVCTDLTEIKALQEQVEMRERMTVLGQMSAGIAHEFRNLMGTILGAVKLIARQTTTASPVQESIQTITHVIADMDHLVTQFLNFARKTDPDLKPVDVEPWLKRVVEQVLEQVPPPHPRVEVTCFPDVLQIRIDEVLMRQALGNLVQNAIESMPGGGRLTVSAGMRPPLGRRREVEVRVSDTGAGIPQDRLGKIFLPFYTTKPKGTGLGLALVHKIILLHNGRIEVESQEHKGTTFRILLPIA
ncbi:MAG TPA: ATP-binding protein [Nitrospirales bacterium]|nr:ATP-binding protein [Nitrospirales bacterium]